MNTFWNWLKDPGTQAVFLLISMLAATGAVFATVRYGKKSLTKRDLKHLEENTAHIEDVKASIASLEARTRRQEEADHYTNEAKVVPISVKGDANAEKPLLLSIELGANEIQCKRIELFNGSGNSFGEVRCESGGNLRFTATIPPDVLMRWRTGLPDNLYQ